MDSHGGNPVKLFLFAFLTRTFTSTLSNAFMNPENTHRPVNSPAGPAPIHSQITVDAPDAATQDECLRALQRAMEHRAPDAPCSLQGQTLHVPSHWEPPFKPVRAVSAQFPSVRITLLADAFQHEYWLARAIFEKGRAVTDDILTLNDGDAFDQLFQHLHHEPYAQWKTKHTQGAVRGGFAWGSVDNYNPAQSELGKAEGQL
ncbi:MAG: hypothetical protein LBD14_03675 [Puniceicoccales bacterium]|jgi:hypothetical protein|nr:hypothetical protein [Puniceicoccales bacterium]